MAPKKKSKKRCSEPQPEPFTWAYEAVTLPALECDVSPCVSLENTTEGEDSEIGSGVNVSPAGLILTAAHMAPTLGCHRVAAFADGTPIDCECVALCLRWDLALLRLNPPKALKKGRKAVKPAQFPTVELSPFPPAPKDKLVCVGQPGRPRGLRLEAVTGRVESVAADPLADQDNESTDGGLVHSCPVFSGNSGSALLMASTGQLVGIHTGYNPQRFSYQGTTLEAIDAFLRESAAA